MRGLSFAWNQGVWNQHVCTVQIDWQPVYLIYSPVLWCIVHGEGDDSETQIDWQSVFLIYSPVLWCIVRGEGDDSETQIDWQPVYLIYSPVLWWIVRGDGDDPETWHWHSHLDSDYSDQQPSIMSRAEKGSPGTRRTTVLKPRNAINDAFCSSTSISGSTE